MKRAHKQAAGALAILTALAAPAEGLRVYAYRDPGGILTVCRGHTGPDVRAGRRYSLAECEAMLDADGRKALAAVDRCHPGLPDSVRGAFGDAVFNIGPRIACDSRRSTAARLLSIGDLRGACNELPKWDKASVAGVLVALPGLTRRRNMERAVCLEGI